MRNVIVCVVTALTSFSFQIAAQTGAAGNPVCNAQFAQLLVDQQVSESKSVVEPEKRIKILLRSADFLWKFDEAKSRNYFSEAFMLADARFKEKGFEEKDAGDKGKGLRTILPDQRMEVITAIAKKDSAWAKKLSEQVLTEYDKAADDRKYNDKTREIGDLLRLAAQNVKSNPEFARYMFRRLMRYPLIFNWYFTLYEIAKTDRKFADDVYSEALANFSNETPQRLLFLSAYPFASDRILGIDKYQYGASVPSGLSPDPRLQRQFIGTFFARIGRYSTSEEDINRPAEQYHQAEPVYMVTALQDMEPIIISRFPDLVGSLSMAKGQAESLLNEDMRKKMDDKQEQTSDLRESFDERISKIEKADDEGKLTDQMIVNLVTWREKTEEQFKRLEPWLEKIKDENARRETINYFWFLRAKLAIKEKRTGDAEKHAKKVPEIEHRVLLMFDIANLQLENQNDAANVFETLNSISKVAHSVDNSVAKAQILLSLANKYERVNHSVALDELGEAIRVINNLDDPDIFGTSITRQIAAKGFVYFAVFDTPGYNLETTFSEISKKDFELSLANAKALDDKYFRTLAVIAVAGNCVKNAKPVPTARPRQ